MRYLLFVSILFFVSCGDTSKKEIKQEEGITTYYLIRHAEKDRNTNDDPELVAQGKERAQFWADYFKEIHLDAIYSTDYKRTQQTAAPLANKKGITVQSYDPNAMYNPTFQQNTQGKSVLIVGHSNTTPTFVNLIIGENRYENINDAENGMLYTVTVKKDGTTNVIVEKTEIPAVL